ncbi:MAG TPA: chemotaxis protein CheC [Geothermobacteraceae bacterium]|nr:chemotaxis protein CheC [Geothermobacteraceae bacterium]
MTFSRLSDLQLDTLRELSNIGMGHAATALSQLLRRGISLHVPNLTVTDISEVPTLLGGAEMVVAGVTLDVLGEARGNILLIFPRESAERLLGALVGQTGLDPLETPLGASTLCEVGNILASAYLTALGQMLQMVLIPSVPRMALDMAGAVVDAVLIELSQSGDLALMLETEFHDNEGGPEPIRGHFFLLPDPETLHVILKTVGEDL